MGLSFDEARERVARGVARLDRADANWRSAIKLSTLVMSDPCKCIVGQWRSWYSSGLEELFPEFAPDHVSFGQQVWNGFDLAWPDTPDADFATLKEAWREAVERTGPYAIA